MSRLLVVARHEFTTHLRRWEFLLVTLGLPLVSGLLLLLASVPNALYLQSRVLHPRPLHVGVVGAPRDLRFPRSAVAGSGLLSDLGGGGKYDFAAFPDRAAAVRALLAKRLDYVYVFAADYLSSGEVEVVRRRPSPFDIASGPPMKTLIVGSLLRGRVNPGILRRVRSPLVESETFLDDRGQPVENPMLDALAAMVLPYAMMLLLTMALLGASTYILRSLVEERESRMLEVLLSALRPADLFYGKILGLGLLGMFQVAVWMALAFPLAALLVGGVFARLDAGHGVLFLAYFILGYLLYAAIIASIGAVGIGEKESNQIFAVFVLAFSSPMLFTPILMDAPDGILPRFFSMLPLTAPLTMVMRSAVGHPGALDLALSLGLMVVSVGVAMRLSLRVFELGLAMYGKTPTPKAIWRALWAERIP